MRILIEDNSQTFKGTPTIKAGKIQIEFKCAHEGVQVLNGEVYCPGCRNTELTDDEAVSLLESYYDMVEAREIDNYQERGY